VRLVKSSKPQKTRRRVEECDKTRRRKKEEGKEDQSLRYMMLITAILAVLIIGGLFYLTRLVFVIDPDLQYHLPYLKPDASEINKEGNAFTVLSEYEQSNDDAMTASKTHRGETTSQSQSQPLLSPSPLYTIPNSMPHIGDKSEDYARLRKDWDERYPPNSPERSLPALKEALANGNNGLSSIYNRLQAPPLAATLDDDDNNNDDDDDDDDKHLDYNIYDCPDDPPPGYPREYKTIDILKHWPPTQSLPVGSHYHHHHPNNNTTANNKNSIKEGNNNIIDGNTAPVMAHLGLCVFDYSRDYEKAMRYRSKEVPFVVRNDPTVAETVERWNDENYRRELFGSIDHSNSDSDAVRGHDAVNDSTTRKAYHRAERSITNQVLFRHSRKKRPPQFNKNYPSSSNKGVITNEKIHGQDIDLPEEGSSQSPPMPPRTKLVAMTYDQWYERAMEKEGNSIIDTDETGIRYYDANPNGKKSLYYYYFRLVGCGEKEGCEKNSTEYLFDEMPFFQPRGHYPQTSESRPNRSGRRNSNHRRGRGQKRSSSMSLDDIIGTTPTEIPESSSSESLYLVQPEKQRGIHCRFGMPGMIAANHYDASRNSIAVLGGSRRYIISRPKQCPNLGLYPIEHESARHSRVDWTTASEDYQNFANNHDNENGEESETQPSSSSSLDNTPSWIDYRKSLSLLANNATSTEVVLQAGDVLYLPSYWFHYIISLTTNMQCNTRSGRDGRDEQIMADCGFPSPRFKP